MATRRETFEHRKSSLPLLYDSHSGSSALLLWNTFARALNYPDRYREMVDWGEKIDSAAYTSVHEAVLGDAPALRINFSLMSRDATHKRLCAPAHTKDFCDYLIRQLRNRSLAEVGELPDIKTKYERVRNLVEHGLDYLRDRLSLLDNIVAFDVEASEDAMISRYAPYYFVPNADYSIGITRTDTCKNNLNEESLAEFRKHTAGDDFRTIRWRRPSSRCFSFSIARSR